MKATRFILALVTTASRWDTFNIPERQKLLHFHIQSLQDEIEDFKLEEFSLCLRLFSQLFQDSLPEFLNKDWNGTVKDTSLSVDSREELLLEIIQLLDVFMKNQICQEYLQNLESSHECFPVVAHLVLLLLKLTTTTKLENSLRVSACATLTNSFCSCFSVSVASSVLPGLLSKLCKLGSESFHEQHQLVIHALDCIRIFIVKCFPLKSEDLLVSVESLWRNKHSAREKFISSLKRQNEVVAEKVSKQTGDKDSSESSVQLKKTISCLQFMLNHKSGPIFHSHFEIRRKAVNLLQDILLSSQVGMAENLRIVMRSLCRLCSDVDTETRLLSIKTLRMYQQRITDASNFNLSRYKEEEVSNILERAKLDKNFEEFEDDDFVIFFNVAEFFIESWSTPFILRKAEDLVNFFIRSGEKFFKDLLSRTSSEESSRIFSILRDITDDPFEADHFILRRYFVCIDQMGVKGALDWFFPLVLRMSESEEDDNWKIISFIVCSQMFLGAMKIDILEESCLQYFFPELISFMNILMQRLSMCQDTEEPDRLYKTIETDSLIYLLLFSTERVIVPNCTVFQNFLLQSLTSFLSLIGHRNTTIANETRRILSRIVCECGYEDVALVLRKYLNYLIDVICEKFIRDGQFYPALHVLLNTDEKLTKECVVLAAKELVMLLETIPYCDSLQASRLLKLVDCTMKRCAPAEQVPLSKSFPYKRPVREPGLYSQPIVLIEKLQYLKLSMTEQVEMNNNNNTCLDTFDDEEKEPFEGSFSSLETLGKNEITESDVTVEDSIVSDLAEKTIMCCIELLPGNEMRDKILCLRTIASSLNVLAMNSKRLLPIIPLILNAVNNELATWNVSLGSEHSKNLVSNGQQESFVYIHHQSEDSLSIKKHENSPNISLLDGFCEVIAQVIRYTGEFSKSTISSVALPKLVYILKLLVSRDSTKFWESTLHSGYAFSSFRCLELITTLEVTLVGGFTEDLVEIVVPILALYSSRMRKKSLNRNKVEQRYDEKLTILYDLSRRILTNLLSADPSTTWYCFYRKIRR